MRRDVFVSDILFSFSSLSDRINLSLLEQLLKNMTSKSKCLFALVFSPCFFDKNRLLLLFSAAA